MFYTLVIVIKDLNGRREGKMERGKNHSRMKLLFELRGVFQKEEGEYMDFLPCKKKKKKKKKWIERIKKEEGSKECTKER